MGLSPLRYVKLRVAHAPGMPGTFSPSSWVSDLDMQHGTCVTHVPWCMPGSLTNDFFWSRWRGKSAPGIPGACATHNFTYLARDPWSSPCHSYRRIFDPTIDIAVPTNTFTMQWIISAYCAFWPGHWKRSKGPRHCSRCFKGSLYWCQTAATGLSIQPLLCANTKENTKACITGFCEGGGTHRWLVDSPHKGPITRKMSTCHYVMMLLCLINLIPMLLPYTQCIPYIRIMIPRSNTCIGEKVEKPSGIPLSVCYNVT